MPRLKRTVEEPEVFDDPWTTSSVPLTPQPSAGTVDVSLKVGHHINMGNYEHLEVDAWVKTTVPQNSDFAKVAAGLKEVAETVLRPSLVLAYETTDEDKSYIKIWPIEIGA